MASEEQASDKLRDYLRTLPPSARSMLIGEIERGLARGEPLPQAEMLLRFLRDSLPTQERAAVEPASPGFGDPARLFFVPLEAFIVDDEPEFAHEARIPRAAIAPMWDWIASDVAPAEVAAFTAEIGRLLSGRDGAKADQAVRVLQDAVAKRLDAVLQTAARDDKERRRIAFRIGTPLARAEVGELATILGARDALAGIGARLPSRIRALSVEQVDQIVAVLEGVLARQKDIFRHALVVVMKRLPRPWHLVRVAKRAAESDQADRIAETPYGVAIAIVLADIERLVRDLVRNVRRGATAAAIADLDEVHEAVRGLRSEIAMGGTTPAARRLAAVRAGVAGGLKVDLETIPGRVRRIIRIVPGKQSPPGSAIDPAEVDEIEGMLSFLGACKARAGELALNELTQRVLSDLEALLDRGSHAILDLLRGCAPAELAYRSAQMDAAIRFCSKVMGEDYATLLTRAADVALSTERKSAKA